MLRHRKARRLQRLREHHNDCQERYDMEITAKTQAEHEKNLQLIEMMNRKKKDQEELLDCVEADSLSESSYDLESDYAPSSSDSSDNENHDGNTKLKFKKKCDKLREVHATSPTKTLTDANEKLNNTDDIDRGRNDHDTDYSADGENEERSQMSVKCCIKGEKRKWDKRHYCIYCKKPQSKMARHLTRKHSDEKEVALATNLPPSSKKRRQMLEGLRRKGNYYHNIEVLQKGQGEIVTYRQPSEHADPEDYLPCNICFGFFLKDKLWKHEKQCRKMMGEPEVQSKKRRRIQTAASSLVPHRGQATQRCSDIVNRMVIDKVSLEVRNDPLICEFGDRLLEKHGSDQSKHGHISQKMRELGRFVLAAKSIDHKVKMLQDVLVPPKFHLAVEAAKKASGFTKSKYRYDTPSLALKLGHSLKATCDIVIGQHIKAEDEVAAARVRSFLGLISAEWDLFVSRRARTNLEEDRWNKKEMIPLTEDVMKLNTVLKTTEEEAKEILLTGPNPKAYKTLSECLLSQIILFNRRRQGEAAKMPLLTYKNRAAEEPNEDIMQGLSKLEKGLSHEFTRLVIRGKRDRKVPVLLTREMTKSLDFLIEQRSEDNDILDSNEYVFARQNSGSHLRGSDCLRKYAAASGARKPETLTSTYLRKHVATMSQIMNLKENELDQLAKFMGHDIRVHREYYRLTENTLQLAKISKLLMAIELGTEAYKGKSLDEIDLGLEIPPSSEVGAVQESQVSGNDLEIFNERSFEDSDEEVNILTQKSVTRRPLDEKKRTEKTGKRQKRVSEPAEDSDEEIDVLTENTVTGRPSDEMKKSEKRGKRRKRVSEPAEDSDEEIDVLTENTVTGRPSDEMKKSEKRGKRRKRVSEPAEDSDEEIDVLTQNTVTGRPSDEMKKSEKRGKRRKRVSEPAEDSDEEVDVLTENTGRPSDEMKKSEKRGLNPQFRKKKKCHRRPWSSEEKAAVWRQLGRYITLHRVPGKELCVKAIEAEQVLCSRNWKDVKNQVYNSITSQKRKQL